MKKLAGLIVIWFLAVALTPASALARDMGGIQCGETRNGAISSAAQEDTWTFTGQAGDRVLISPKATPGRLTLHVTLYPPQSDAAEASDYRLDHQLEQSGTYRIVVYDVAYSSTGGYNITLLNLTDTECPGTSIASGQTLSGALKVEGDLDVYTFHGRAGDRVLITPEATSGKLIPYVTLYPPYGGAAETSGYSLDHPLEQSGPYKVVVRDDNYLFTGNYDITLTRVIPDLRVAALSVSPSPAVKSQPSTISWTIENTGIATAPSGQVLRVRRSDDPTYDESDALIQQVRIDSTIEPGGQASGTCTFDTTDAAPGGYWLVAMADATDVVSELSEDNNTQSTPVNIELPKYPPSLSAIPDSAVMAGQAWSCNIAVTGAPSPTCSLAAAPAGMTIDPAANVISWTPTKAQIGSHTVTVAATNEVGSDSKTFTIEVSPIPAALAISHSGPGRVTTPGENSFPYDHGTSVSVAATPEPNNPCAAFTGWTGTAVDKGRVADPASPGTTVLVDGEYTLQANFALLKHALTILPGDWGSVVIPGAGTSYDCGSQVPITAKPKSGWCFAGWTGTAVDAGKVADPTSMTTTVLMDGNYSLQATFTPCVVMPQVNTLDVTDVTLASASLHGQLVSDGNDACQCWFEYWTEGQDTPSITSMVSGKRTGASFRQSLTGLQCGTTYYYRARASNTAGSAAGTTASFTTDPAPIHLTVSSAAGGTVIEPGIGTFAYCEPCDVSVRAEPTVSQSYFWHWTGTAVDTGKIPGGDVTSPRTAVHADANDAIHATFLRTIPQWPDDVDRAMGRGKLFSTSQLWDFCDATADANGISRHLYDIAGAAPNGRAPLPGTMLADADGTSGASPRWWPADPYEDSGRKGLIASSGLRASINTWQSHATATSVWLQIVWRPCGDGDTTPAPQDAPAEPVLTEMDPPRTAFRLFSGEFLPYGWRRSTYAWDVAASPAQVRFTIGGRILIDSLIVDTYTENPVRHDEIHVDDDALRDPGPYDMSIDDPLEDGTAYHPFDSIQEAIEAAQEGATIIVHGGRYAETINLRGKAIAVVAEWLINPDGYAPSILDAGGFGPAVRLTGSEGSNCIVSGLTILGGKAPAGAAILCEGGSPTISHCILGGNRATADQGAIVVCKDSRAKFINCTITGNRVGRNAAALSFTDSCDTMVNCIVWDNEGPAIHVESGSLPSITYSDVEGGWPGLGALNTDPLFASAGSWQDAGTPDDPTDDLWVMGDYHLRSLQGRFDPVSEMWVADPMYSPCIDAGSPSGIWSQESSSNGYRVNMGAYGGTRQAGRSTSSDP